jgi:tRNA (guanine-N7-)-methyltransferase
VSRALPLIELPTEPLDWERLFAVPRPVQVEIGSGKGRFLIAAAERDRTTNWVGLERRWTALALGVERIAGRGLDNALVIRCDAMQVVRRLIPPASVAGFHVYYPDPWWKARQRKRRVFNPAFVADLARGLAPAGELRLATDVAEYYEEILQVVGASGLFEPRTLTEEEWTPGGAPLTSFEAKYRAHGKTVHRAAFRRGAGAAPPPEPWVNRKPRGEPLAERLLAPRPSGRRRTR